MRGIWAGLIAAALCLAQPALAGPRTDVVVGMSVEPSGLDPTVAAPVAIGQVVWQNVFEGLTRVDRDGRVQPQLASAWTIEPDGLTYRFTLRRGVRFHDGSAFDASVAKFALDRARGPASTNPQKQFFTVIDTVEAPDATTLVLRLREPSGNLLYWLGWPAAVMVSPASAETNRVTPVGTGPFAFSRWAKGDRVELVRASDYWDPSGAARLERATFRFVPEAQAQAAGLRAGDLDAVPELAAPELFGAFTREPRFSAIEGRTDLKVVAGLNTARKPLDDPRVRRALMMAIDRKALIEGASSGLGQPIGSHFAPNDPGYVDLTGVLPYDPAGARALLAQAGFGGGLALTIKTPQMAYATRSAEVLQAMLAEVGVTLTIAPTEFPARWIAEVFKAHDFDMTIVAHAEPLDIGIYARPDYYFGFHDATFDATVRDAERATDPSARADAYARAQRILAQAVPALYLYVVPKLGVADARLKGLWANEPIPSNDLREARWEE